MARFVFDNEWQIKSNKAEQQSIGPDYMKTNTNGDE